MLCALAFPPLGWSWLLLVALTPLLWVWYQQERPGWHGFWWTAVLGVVGFWHTLSAFSQRTASDWVSGISWTVALLWFCASYALIGWLTGHLKWRGVMWAFGVACFWTAISWLRSLGAIGIAWGVSLGAVRAPLLIQPADLGGMWLVEWLIVFWNALLVVFVTERRAWQGGLIALTAISWLAYGVWGYQYYERFPRTLPVAVLQVETWIFSQVYYEKGQKLQVEKALAEASRQGAKWAILPESFEQIHHFDQKSEAQVLGWWRSLSDTNQLEILLGASRSEADRAWNSAVWVASNDQLAYYNKVKGMAFTEVLPSFGTGWLRLLGITRERSIDRGGTFQCLGNSQGGCVGPIICVESVFGWIARGQVRAGAQWLAVLTNDWWLGHSYFRQMFADYCVLRAVETRRWVARVSPLGVSGFYSPSGRRSELPQGRYAVQTEAIAPLNAQSLYVRWGDWWAYLCGLIGLVALGSKMMSPVR